MMLGAIISPSPLRRPSQYGLKLIFQARRRLKNFDFFFLEQSYRKSMLGDLFRTSSAAAAAGGADSITASSNLFSLQLKPDRFIGVRAKRRPISFRNVRVGCRRRKRS